jgi:hypothetical protein
VLKNIRAVKSKTKVQVKEYAKAVKFHSTKRLFCVNRKSKLVIRVIKLRLNKK